MARSLPVNGVSASTSPPKPPAIPARVATLLIQTLPAMIAAAIAHDTATARSQEALPSAPMPSIHRRIEQGAIAESHSAAATSPLKSQHWVMAKMPTTKVA